jgi:hypothetical protein
MKTEDRNPKPERNPKFEIRMDSAATVLALIIRASAFVPLCGISDFGLRISDLERGSG